MPGDVAPAVQGSAAPSLQYTEEKRRCSCKRKQNKKKTNLKASGCVWPVQLSVEREIITLHGHARRG